MKSKLIVIFLLILSINHFDKVKSQSGICRYRNFSFYNHTYYGCKLLVNKLYGTQINGQHESDKTDCDVEYLYDVTLLDLSHFPKLFCEKFTNLKVINFRNNELQKVDENSLENCENIEELSLAVNKIKNLPKNVFKGHKKLKTLWLYKNQIEELTDGVFDSLINLELLSMSHNKLKKLSPKLFANLSKLKNLFLDENQLVELPAKIFSPLVSLEKLWLDGNKFTIFHSSSFGKLPKLQNFNFNSTQLSLFDEKIIANMPQLNTIDAGSNPCVTNNEEINDHSPSSTQIREALKICFDNYRETLDGRVGQLEDEKIKITQEIKTMKDEKQLMNENINNLTNDNEEIRENYEKIMQAIETQVIFLRSEDIITTDEIKQLKSADEELEAKLEVLSAANEDIQHRFLAKFIKISKKIEDNAKANEKIIAANQDREEIMTIDVETKFDELTAELMTKHEQFIQSLSDEISKLKNNDEIAMNENDKLKQQMNDLKAKNSELIEENKNILTIIETLRKQSDEEIIRNSQQVDYFINNKYSMMESNIEQFKNQINVEIMNLKNENEKLKAKNEEIKGIFMQKLD